MSGFIISLIACTIGSLIGIGGGIIIIPILISMGISKELAAFSSSMAVIAMATLSGCTYIRRKQGNIKIAILMGLGSVPGSSIGVYINKSVEQDIFNLLFIALIIILILVMILKRLIPPIKLKNWTIPIIGLLIGILSGTFGIGGGPIIIPCLLVLFSFEQKDAAATSVYITAITTMNSLINHIGNGNTNMSLAKYMIPAAFVGSIIGTNMNRKIKDKIVGSLFIIVLAVILCNQVILVIF